MGYFPFTSRKQRKIKPDDLGLDAMIKARNSRLLDKEGQIRIKRKGIKSDLFHKLALYPTWKFIFWLVSIYLIINLIFAGVYFVLGRGALGFTEQKTTLDFFLTCIYFSAQTLTTVGYGVVSPVSHAANIVATFQALSGWVFFAIITGLVYARFSLPKSGIVFSKNAIVNTTGDYPQLQCRLAGNMQGILMELDARMMVSWIERHENGEHHRVYMQLPLNVQKVYMLSLSWTLTHKIDEQSPLYNKTSADLIASKAEIMVSVRGENELFLQTIHAQTSYLAEEIIWGASFSKTHDVDESGETTFYLDRLDDYKTLGKEGG